MGICLDYLMTILQNEFLVRAMPERMLISKKTCLGSINVHKLR